MATLDVFQRRRRWILLLAAAGASGYAVYHAYHLPWTVRTRQRLISLFRTATSISEAVSSSTTVVSRVSSDLNDFLRSDSDEIPQSLRQILKIYRSDEFSSTVSRTSEALTIGIARGLRYSASQSGAGFADRVLDRLFSASGSGFASVVVGSFARNLVMAFFSGGENGESEGPAGSGLPAAVPGWVPVICGDECRELISDSIQLFVSTAVAVFLDKTAGTNTYEELFSGLTNPKHEAKVKEILVSLCNAAVQTLVTTSHKVLTAPKQAPIAINANVLEANSENRAVIPRKLYKMSTDHHKDNERGGWMGKISSTMAVPSNRKLVLDMTGRVTFETIRCLLDFVLRKVYESAMTAASFVHTELVERGLELVRYISAKSMAIVTVCLSLCMPYVVGTRFLTLA